MIVFVIPFSKLLLGDVKRYMAPRPLAAMALIISGTVMAVVPMLPGVNAVTSDGSLDGGSSAQQLAWAAIYTGSYIPQALSGVLQQLVMLALVTTPRVKSRLRSRASVDRTTALLQVSLSAAGKPLGAGGGEGAALLGGPPAPAVHPFLSATAFSLAFALIQASTLTVMVGACFWVDFLPWLGVSSSFSVFRQTVSDTVACSLAGSASGVPGCTDMIPVYMLGVCAGSAVNIAGSVILTWQSAVFAQVAACAGTAMQSAIWLVPAVAASVGSAVMPLWAVVPAFAMSVSGIMAWKNWEHSYGSVEDGSVFVAVKC